MPHSFESRLQEGANLVADGATGTNLQKRGLPPGTPPEVWLFERPDEILALHRSWVASGSDLVLTCTFGGTRYRLLGTEWADRASEVNRKAVSLAREATAGTNVLVAGSIGPTGLMLEPYGTLTFDGAKAAFSEQVAGLVEGVDLFVVETFFDLEEARAAIEAIRLQSDKPVVVSFSFDRGKKTMMGVAPADVARTFIPMGVAAIGANCGRSLSETEAILAAYAEAAPGFPLWVKPNAGLPHGEENAYEVSPADMAEFAGRFIRLGARIVGGCCGSTPAHVKAISDAVHALVT